MPPIDGDTIVARATARGIAAIAMIRLSGPEAFYIAEKCFERNNLGEMNSHTAHVGIIHTPGGEEIDQVVVIIYKAPNTVTGENVVEITCHGGDYVSHRILNALVGAGARPAEPGEFTQRAFLNGKMDLAQAEAVGEIIHAGSRRAQDISLAHLKGSYSILLGDLRREMLDLCAFIELELDFTEEDVEFADRDRLMDLLHRSTDVLGRLLGSYRYGAAVRDGIVVVIGGRPNAGKSTLLNALVGYDRAIVSEMPGTTRDEIGAEAEYDGIRLHFLDTAGLRETQNEIEAEGVRRAEDCIRRADALLYVYDAMRGLDEEERCFLDDLAKTHPELTVIVIANKWDLMEQSISLCDHMKLSARDATADEQIVLPLLDSLVDSVVKAESLVEGADVVTNERHKYHLTNALQAVTSAMVSVESERSGDIVALDLRVAMKEIGAITGATATEDILDRIFSRFCIGK